MIAFRSAAVEARTHDLGVRRPAAHGTPEGVTQSGRFPYLREGDVARRVADLIVDTLGTGAAPRPPGSGVRRSRAHLPTAAGRTVRPKSHLEVRVEVAVRLLGVAEQLLGLGQLLARPVG